MIVRTLIGWPCAFIATLGPIGYLPAPGTCGTVAAVFLLWGARLLAAWYGISELVMICLVMVFAFFVIQGALLVLKGNDPQEIVLDEVVGYFVAMYLSPWSLIPLALSFILFRLFDIEKPLGIESLQQLPGAWGVIADDVAAGLLTTLVLSWVLFGLRFAGVLS